ncbi:esterase-like activity of phytase family protein [Monaibacterium marinum]|uniref:esterase-like activity of phytase family protein n=1 Tax=Pontivivens marinum TaxID=1690039 RepID=UPI0015E0A902|nr:esterase-like activity of phytase family protein [Monaibacterium marinum]
MSRSLLLVMALLGGCVAAQADTAQRVSQIEWNGQGAEFGGLSGLLIGPDGQSLIAVSDKGLLITAALQRDADGTLRGVVEQERHRLISPAGQVMFDKDADAESLAWQGDRLLISLERRNAIWAYDALGGTPVEVPVPQGITALQFNSGVEAMANLPDGTVLAIPERSGALDRPFPVFRLRDGVWDSDLQIPREPPYLPTAADIGPDGRLYVLERDFTGLGFRVQVRSFAIGDQITDMQRVLSPTTDMDNAEGMDIWRDPAGQLRMTIISDDNFLFLQRTLLTEYVLNAAD